MIYPVDSPIYAAFISAGKGSAADKASKKLDNAGAKREALEWR